MLAEDKQQRKATTVTPVFAGRDRRESQEKRERGWGWEEGCRGSSCRIHEKGKHRQAHIGYNTSEKMHKGDVHAGRRVSG